VKCANHDGASATIAQTENTILGAWASALLGSKQWGSDYSLWQKILLAKTGSNISGAFEQRLVRAIVKHDTGVEHSGMNKFELISTMADFIV